MRYLVAGYWTEGASDGYLLVPIIERALERWLLRRTAGHYDFLMLPVRPPDGIPTFVGRVVALVEENRAWIELLFVHTDADRASTARARSERIRPAMEAAGRVAGADQVRLVSVVLARESEAWLLVSEDAVTGAVGRPMSPGVLGFPRARDVARVADPKALLDHAVRTAIGTRRMNSRAVKEAIARRVPLAELDAVTAFREFTAELDTALSTSLLGR